MSCYMLDKYCAVCSERIFGKVCLRKRYHASILYKSIANRVADGPITARYRCIKNAD